MKRIKSIYKVLPALLTMLCLHACDSTDIKDIAAIREKLELTASAETIALDEDNLTSDIITFTWTEAREMQNDDYLVSYTTKLDLVGNNFGSSTAIMTYEDDGVFSKSFTSEQLNNWANEKWKTKVNQPFTLEFRVVAEWAGGQTFEAPEVRTVSVNVNPIRVEVFEADNMFIAGTALPGGEEKEEMALTLENASQYAWMGELVAGELQVPVVLNGDTYYIIPTDGEGTLQDGEPEAVKMQETPISWTIPSDGEYRVVVNMEKATITIYSPDKALEPRKVEWGENSATVTELWLHGNKNNWGAAVKGNFSPSLADPQILVYSGDPLSGWDRVKFVVTNDNPNGAYAFSCVLNGDAARDETLSAGTLAELSEGSSSAQRNSYFKLPSGTNFIVMDLRNMTILADIK